MAVRFRKSKKVAPGTKINVGGKSAGVSFGNRGGGISFNSRTGARVRASIPRTGISFSRKLGGRKRRKKTARRPIGAGSYIVAALVMALICWIFPIAIPLFILAIVGIFAWAVASAKKEAAASGQAADTSDAIASVTCPACSEQYTIRYKAAAAAADGSIKLTCPKCKTVFDAPTS